ncbi:MAG: SAM-dependent methyltransferase, partial [Bacilli bacterium]|nr:SAM-dependent methyltransferase [Bacilli bacterium]
LEKEKYNTYDLLICNPPYFSNLDKSTKNDNIHKTIARHEIKINLEDILKVTNRLLKDGGVFSMINRTDRLIELINIFKKYNIEPKKIKFIHKDINSESTMVYIEGIKNGNCGLKIDSPFYIYNVDGSESHEYLEICKEVLK